MNGRSKRWFLKALATIVVALALIVGIAIAAALYVMAQRDKEHAKFFNNGKSVNVFLGSYTKAIRDGFEKKDPAPVLSLYSDRFWSPGRGRWEMALANEESDVSVSKIVIKGQQDFDKQALRGEVVKYL